jgi:hypothetical protein
MMGRNDFMNVLNQTYEADNFKPNSKTYQITMTVDGDFGDTSEANSILCNNGSRYKTVEGITLLSTNSSATIYSPNFMYIYSFISEYGTMSTTTGYNEGIWKCIAKIGFK